MMKNITASLLLLTASFVIAHAGEPTLSIDVSQPIAKSSPLLYGLMTEEINHCYDGGLYAELVQNRTFQDDGTNAVHWSVVSGSNTAASIALDRAQPLNEHLPVSLRLDVSHASPASLVGIANDGYWGIPVKAHTRYRASFYAKAAPGFSSPVMVSIVNTNGTTVYAKAKVSRLASEWQRYEVTLKTGGVTPTADARLVLSVNHAGTVWFDLVSLFPPTWNDRPNGLRKDLMQMLVNMKPAFLRFPGGNYLEGDTIDTRFKWWETLGPLTNRPGHPCPWGYRSSDGMGLLEFLLWCEDLKAEPVLGLYAGYSLKGEYVKPGPELEPFVQEALEEIEYVTGSVTTKWGAQRAKDGHPKPFKLHYVEIGNEDFFDHSGSYDGRFAQFFDAIKKKHPELECIASIGYTNTPTKGLVSSRKPDVMDIHFYRSTEEFLKKITEFDTRFDRQGPRAFIGEWAAHEDGKIKPWSKEALKQPPTPSMKAAIGDAACMAAMERNSDIIAMQCYAPLFANVNPGAWQWRPNLIGYDVLRAYGSPSYYAFAMFSQNRGDQILQATLTDSPLQCSVVKDTKAGTVVIKLVNPEVTAQAVKIELKGIHSVASTATVITLAAKSGETNSLEQPRNVVPKQTNVNDVKPSFSYTVPANGIAVLKLMVK
jgi:alpha-L-arabinofuranosidase